MGVNAFRSLDQYYAGHGFALTSWRNLFKALPVGRELLNSTLITVGAIALILAVSTTGGYAFAVLRYRTSRLVFLIVIALILSRSNCTTRPARSLACCEVGCLLSKK